MVWTHMSGLGVQRGAAGGLCVGSAHLLSFLKHQVQQNWEEDGSFHWASHRRRE